MITKVEVHTHVTPWRFDGHGINDNEGQRIAKVSCCEPYVYGDEGPQRNADFDRVSNLIAAAPEMLEALENTCAVLETISSRPSTMSVYDVRGRTETLEAGKAVIRKARGE